MIKYKNPKVDVKIPPVEKITTSDIVDYLNEVLMVYGPPCEWCKNFDSSGFCNLNYRPRKYYLELGPFTDWYLRKFCDCFEETEETEEENNKQIEKHIRQALNCFVQQYCG